MTALQNKNSQLGTIISLTVAVIAFSFAPILICLSENELSPYGTIFNALLSAIFYAEPLLVTKHIRDKIKVTTICILVR